MFAGIRHIAEGGSDRSVVEAFRDTRSPPRRITYGTRGVPEIRPLPLDAYTAARHGSAYVTDNFPFSPSRCHLFRIIANSYRRIEML